MSELSSSNCQFSSLLISDLIRLFSLILSHPLYFSYFIFFSPYLLKLISFLSPLFLTTLILFLAGIESQQTRFASIIQRLQFKKDSSTDEPPLSDHLGIYETVFGPDDEKSEFSDIADDDNDNDFEENEVPVKSGNPCVVMEEKRLENFFKILDEFERLASNVEEMKKKIEPPPRGAKSDKVVEKQRSLLMNGSNAAENNNTNIKEESQSPVAKSESQRTTTTTTTSFSGHRRRDPAGDEGSLSSYGSMRREREWERTLAGKLFEERQSAASDGGGGGGEGMDSLWEAYEMEEFCKAGRRRKEKVKTEKCREREWEEEEEEDIGGQLCCLQALKLSAGKVVLGMGKPNLVKISKAIKGFGWLHKTTKNSKKVHHHRF